MRITRGRFIQELSNPYYLDKYLALSEKDKIIFLRHVNLLTEKCRNLGINGAVEVLSKLGSFLNKPFL